MAAEIAHRSVRRPHLILHPGIRTSPIFDRITDFAERKI
jgi:hypothetical protein